MPDASPLLAAEYSGHTADESVRAGRTALDSWLGGYPWYDEAEDGIRRVDVSPSWYERLLEWLSQFRPSFSWPRNFWDYLAWTGMAVLLALLGWLFYKAFRRIRNQLAVSGEVGTETDGDDTVEAERRSEALPAPAARTTNDLLEEARRNYEAGRYGEAIIYLFSHQLVELDKSGLIRLTKGKTNRQYLGELGPQIDLRRIVEQTMVVFEDAFFGNYTIDRTRFEACWSRLDEFQTLAQGAPA